MSLELTVGPQARSAGRKPKGTAGLCALKRPILTDAQLAKIEQIDRNGFKTKKIAAHFKAGTKKDFVQAL